MQQQQRSYLLPSHLPIFQVLCLALLTPWAPCQHSYGYGCDFSLPPSSNFVGQDSGFLSLHLCSACPRVPLMNCSAGLRDCHPPHSLAPAFSLTTRTPPPTTSPAFTSRCPVQTAVTNCLPLIPALTFTLRFPLRPPHPRVPSASLPLDNSTVLYFAFYIFLGASVEPLCHLSTAQAAALIFTSRFPSRFPHYQVPLWSRIGRLKRNTYPKLRSFLLPFSLHVPHTTRCPCGAALDV
eukprot:1138052-Pelagomonas_calceolata.AAC.5